MRMDGNLGLSMLKSRFTSRRSHVWSPVAVSVELWMRQDAPVGFVDVVLAGEHRIPMASFALPVVEAFGSVPANIH